MTLTAPPSPATRDTAPPTPRPRTTRKTSLRTVGVVTHRWASLTLGVFLMLLAITGSILLYEPEITRALNPAAYSTSTGSHAAVAPAQFGAATAAVKDAHPHFTPTGMRHKVDVVEVRGKEPGRQLVTYTVDPVTTRVLGEVNRPAWLGLSYNLHHCGLTCEHEAGYIAWMDAEVPYTSWLGRNKNLHVGGLVLGALGVLLVFLCLTGLYLWWPKKWKRAFQLRLAQGRFARDTDLHKQLGMLFLLPLLMWGFTGAGFELAPVEKAWYATTFTTPLERLTPSANAAAKGPLLPVEVALARVTDTFPGMPIRSVSIPPAKGPNAATTPYSVALASPVDSRAHGAYPGDVNVAVDPRTGDITRTRNRPQEPWSQQVWNWNFGLHTGAFVNSWGRVPLLLGGVTLVLLGVTGLSTWCYRMGTKRRRARAQRH